MKQLTKEFMQENCGCYSQDELMRCSFMKSEPISLDSILNSEIPLKDKFWFVCRKIATKEQNQQIAIGVAEIVLIIYENKYPEDKRPREAIKAAKDYLSGIIEIEELRTKRAAAYAAYAAAAYAAAAAAAAAAYADAAYAAAYAAAAAYADAAYAAAYAAAAAAAADAAAYAAAAAAAADAAAYAAADALKQSLLNFLIEFCKNNDL